MILEKDIDITQEKDTEMTLETGNTKSIKIQKEKDLLRVTRRKKEGINRHPDQARILTQNENTRNLINCILSGGM